MIAQLEQITDKIQHLSSILGAEFPHTTPCSEYQWLKPLREYPELAFLRPAAGDMPCAISEPLYNV